MTASEAQKEKDKDKSKDKNNTDWSQVPLPPGWERSVEADSHGKEKIKYINHNDKETQNFHPSDAAMVAKSQAKQAKKKAKEAKDKAAAAAPSSA